MSSSDVGSYEFKRSPWMQMEECSARLASLTSDGSSDNNSNTIASRIPAARPEGSPFAARGILSYYVRKLRLSLSNSFDLSLNFSFSSGLRFSVRST